MKFPFIRGARVRAKMIITEAGPGESPDRSKTIQDNGRRFFPGYVHAEAGELGTVVEVDDPMGDREDPDTGEIRQLNPIPTVRFDRTNTATIVCESEIELIEPLELLGCEKCGSYNKNEVGKCWYGVQIAGPGHRCLEWWEK
jgi:hypothetical protein